MMGNPPLPLELIAYLLHDQPTNMPITAAELERDWMDAAPQRFPYRCLPLNIANQHGWWIGCPARFRAYWYGGLHSHDIELAFDGEPNTLITSHFGNGVLTFSIPYLFRTPPGINLWIKGPSNRFKPGIQALEGIVETDWAASTFTMNWKFTRPNEWVEFDEGEPICMLVPTPRGLLEQLHPVIRPLYTNRELRDQYVAWEKGRRGFLQGIYSQDPEAIKRGWQKDYFQGKIDEGTQFTGHQTRLHLREFEQGG
jgi:hypothetical protein